MNIRVTKDGVDDIIFQAEQVEFTGTNIFLKVGDDRIPLITTNFSVLADDNNLIRCTMTERSCTRSRIITCEKLMFYGKSGIQVTCSDRPIQHYRVDMLIIKLIPRVTDNI